MICAYLFAHLKLTEHGSSLSCPWLTDLGKEALAFLLEYRPEWNEGSQEFIDSVGCSWGNL